MWLEIFLSVLVLWIFWNSLKKPSDYPPGIWGFPLFGYIPFGENYREKLRDLRKKHGDIFCWRVGTQVVVFLYDYKTIKEAYNTQTFAFRPQLGFLAMLPDHADTGIILTNGPHWQNIRRFTLRHLRDLGMGKSKIVSAVHFEAMEFVKELKKQNGKSAPLSRTLKPAIINILWQMVVSKRYEFDDRVLIEFEELIMKVQDNFSNSMFEDIFPWITSIIPKKLLHKLIKRNVHMKFSNTMQQIFREYINEHAATIDENDPRDFVDEYLMEMKNEKLNPDSTMSIRDLIGCIADLFGAGLETTAATIYWSILYMTEFPEVQIKLQKEIEDILPSEELATLDDRSRLPYTEAFINEVLRYSSLTVFGVPRTVLNDTKLGGYTIPKDAVILSSIEANHFNSSNFDSPKEFRPERFLNSDGKVEAPKTGFFPFGTGKRQCIGESLARTELLIFITTIVKYISFAPPPNKKLDLRPRDSLLFNLPRTTQDILVTVRE